MEEGGAKRIVVVIAIVAVASIGVFWYWQHAKQRALRSGNVYVKDSSPNQAQAPSSGQPTSPPIVTNSSVPAPQSEDASADNAPSGPVTSAPKPSAGVEKPAPHSAAPAPVEPRPMVQPRGAVEVPVSDTIQRNPPSGLIFAGAGKYQLYRQGDITWRLDTDNGRACIIFATDSQWTRVRVWDQGCGAS